MTPDTFTTDNRWSAGASGAGIPSVDRIVAAYGARWIDHGDRADVVPDRQGFAYDRPECRDLLIDRMVKLNPAQRLVHGMARDQVVCLQDGREWQVFARRAGGYVYVDAWLFSDEDEAARTAEDRA
jgi:hypothetical protein